VETALLLTARDTSRAAIMAMTNAAIIRCPGNGRLACIDFTSSPITDL
jgi:hypothetical protein